MGGILQTLQVVLQDPSQNYRAVGVGIAIVVLAVISLVLLAVFFALPRPEEYEERELEPRAREQVRQYRRVRSASYGVVALMAVLAAGAAAVVWRDATSSNEYCTTVCHRMAEPAQSWRVSAHSAVDCIRCHEDGDPSSVLPSVASRLRSLGYEITGASSPGAIVPETRCLGCHGGMMADTLVARNGEPFTHREALSDGRECTSCHDAQGHVTPRDPLLEQ